jgi:hypothetical protein
MRGCRIGTLFPHCLTASLWIFIRASHAAEPLSEQRVCGIPPVSKNVPATAVSWLTSPREGLG